MKKYFILLAIIVAALLVFAACNTDPAGNKPTEVPKTTDAPTDAPTDVPTEAPTATPEPTATPTPEPGTYDLLGFEADEDHMTGDGWSYVDGAFCGPLEEPHEGEDGATLEGVAIYAHREVAVVELSNGEQGSVIRHAVDGDRGLRIGQNVYGVEYAGLKPATRYRLKATFMASGTFLTDRSNSHIIFGLIDGLGGTPVEGNYVEIESKQEWQTLELVVYTGDAGMAHPAVVLGTNGLTGCINWDYEMLVEDIEMYEIVEKELLDFVADGDHMTGDGWSYVDGAFCGPLEEPQQGPEGASLDGVKLYAHREVTTMEGPDGETVDVIRHALDADTGYRRGTNRYGIKYADLKPNTKYRLKATFYVCGTFIPEKEPGSDIIFGLADGLNGAPKEGNFVYLESKNEWQTIEIIVDTGEGMEQPAVVLGTNGLAGWLNFDYEMNVASIEMYEYFGN